MSSPVGGPLVRIKCENLDELKQETEDGDGDNTGSKKVVLLATSSMNNNGKQQQESSSTSCFLRIKEEPLDEDVEPPRQITAQGVLGTAEFPASVGTNNGVSTVEVDVNQGITIKTEVVDKDETQNVNVDEVDEDFDEDDSSIDDECDFEDDEDDKDYEMDSENVDTPDSFSTSDGASRNSKISGEDKDDDQSVSPDSMVEVELGKDEVKEEEEDTDSKRESFDFNGMKIETVGNYSKCPKCDKNIKSTFIIRHIKLHDFPNEKFSCPEKGCNLKVNRINNLFRHLREIHKSKKPYVCRKRDCGARFAKAQLLKSHNSVHRAERRKKAETESENR